MVVFIERKAAQQKAIKITTQKTAAYKDLTADMQQQGGGNEILQSLYDLMQSCKSAC